MKKLFSKILAISVLASASSALAAFSDVENHWAADSINTWSDYGVISGYDGYFAPDKQITRGEFAVILNRLMNYKKVAENSFVDLDDNFYTDAILKLNEKNVISGYDGMVNPNGLLTREEAAVMLCRALEIDAEDALERSFTDEGEISEWAKPYINALVNRGLLNGYDGKLNPKNTITRAEVVTILNNAVYPILTSGEKADMTVDKILVISAGDVTVSNFVTNGNVIITEGAEEGTVAFQNTKINGFLKISNDRTDFVKLENATVAYGDVLEDDAIVAESNATVDSSNATGGRPAVSTGGSSGGGNSSGGDSSSGSSGSGGSGSGSSGGGSGNSSSGSESTGGDSGSGGSGSGSSGGGSGSSSSGSESSGGSGNSSSGSESTGGDSGSGGSGSGSTGGDSGSSSSGSGSSGGGSGSSGSGSGSSGGGSGSSGSGSGSSGGDSGSSGSGSGSSGGNGGSSSSGSGSTGGSDEKEDIDYAAVNKEMIENLEIACDDITENISDPIATPFSVTERKALKIILQCMEKTLEYKDKAVIDSEFIKKTFKDEIDDVMDIYDSMGDEDVTKFQNKLVVNLNSVTIEWLLNEFGLMDKLGELM